MAFKTKKFQVETFNSIQGVYPDVLKTKKFKTILEAKNFGKSEHNNFTGYRIRKDGKVIEEVE